MLELIAMLIFPVAIMITVSAIMTTMETWERRKH
jgi:hypothetical protein